METADLPVAVRSLAHECSGCEQRAACLPAALSEAERGRLGSVLVQGQRTVPRGQALFRLGDRCTSLYAVWSGSFKTSLLSSDGTEHVTGFVLSAELLGLDGMGSGRHHIDAVALEDAQVCVIPLASLRAVMRYTSALQQQFQLMFEQVYVRHQETLSMLGSRSADERVAAFLIDMAQRLHARGSPASSVLLRMTRDDIGNFLGLTVETVSRTLSRFQASRLLDVQHRMIRFVDLPGLHRLVNGETG